MHGPRLTRVGRWIWICSFLALWVVALFQMIANYLQDPYNPGLLGTAAYGHNEENALLRGIILGLVELAWLYLVVRPWSFKLLSFWSAGRLVVALCVLVPWTGFWWVGGIHGGGVTRINNRWLLAVDLILMIALVSSLLASAWRWVPRDSR
jgi:hypothetical protein